MNRIPLLVTGLQGLVGSKLAQLYDEVYSFENLDIHHPTSPTDITNFEQVHACFEKSSATAVVHLAAFTDVTAAWQQNGDTQGIAYQVNVTGTENIARAAAETGKHLIHISTAYVFSGSKAELYTEEDTPSPIEWYGHTKFLAEEKVQKENLPWTILRIDQPFRSDDFSKPDIVRKMADKMKAAEKPAFFNDHFFGPTYIDNFCKIIDWFIKNKVTGLFHATSGEMWNDFEFAKALSEIKHLPPNFVASSLSEYLKTSQRPYQLNTAMDSSKLKKLLDFPLLTVKEALSQVQL